MPTANERRALWFLAAVALSGSVVRLARSREREPAPDPALQRQIGRIDSARSAPKERRAKPAKVAKPGPVMVDLNQASAAEIEALPGIGPALAARIVAARDSLRGFRDLGGLCAVRGVGPALVARVGPQVTISGDRPVENARCPESLKAKKSVPR